MNKESTKKNNNGQKEKIFFLAPLIEFTLKCTLPTKQAQLGVRT